MSKKQKPRDRHLDVPVEAKRDKHINFVADERSETDPSIDRTKGPLNDEDSDKDTGEKKNKEKRRN